MSDFRYEHDFINKRALERVLAWDYADQLQMGEDLGNAFHWPATPQGRDYWHGVSQQDPVAGGLEVAARVYLEWLLYDSGKSDPML